MAKQASARGAEPPALVMRPATAADEANVAELLASAAHLDTTFEPPATWVAEEGGVIVATGRVRGLACGGSEIAGVVVARNRRGEGIGEMLASGLLQSAARPVWALALAPGFFARLGFAEVSRDQLPAVLQGKARTTCASVGFVPMRLA